MVVNRFVDAFLRSQSVPIYYFISCFVFFYAIRLTREVYAQKLRNRVKTLLIPYLLWNAITIIVLLLKMFPAFQRFSSYASSASFSWGELLSSAHISDGALYLTDPVNNVLIYLGNPLAPVDGPLWFLSYLMIVVLLAPALYWLLRRIRLVLVAALGITWFILGCLSFNYLYLFFTALFYFSFGAYLSICEKDMLAVFGRYFWSSVALYPFLAVLHVVFATFYPTWAVVIKHLTIFAGLFFAYNIATLLLNRNIIRVNPFLASASFFIYVSHFLLCSRVIKVLFVLLKPSSDLAFVALYLLAALVTVSLLMLAFYLLRRYCPTVLRVLAGRK